MWKTNGNEIIERNACGRIDADKSNIPDEYSNDMNCINGKSKDIFIEYAIRIWK